MSGACPTVKIKNGDGYTVINESDFNDKEHKIYEAPKVKEKKEKKESKKVEKIGK